MAKVTLPVLGVDASGTIGDSVTFGRWRGVNYARTRVVPANPRTTAQTSQRALMTWVVRAWQFSPAVVQAAFYAAAKGLKMTAFNLFTKKNMVVLRPEVDNSLVVVSPGQSGAPAIVAIDATGGTGELQVAATVGDVVAGTSVESVHFIVMQRQNIREAFIPPIRALSDNTAPYSVTFTGLTAGDYVAAAFVEAIDAKGNRLFGAQLNDVATVT